MGRAIRQIAAAVMETLEGRRMLSGSPTVVQTLTADSAPANQYISPVVFQGATYYAYVDPSGTGSLWRTDGTGAGTTLVKNLDVRQMIAAGNTLYLFCQSGSNYSLWASDGTASGTSEKADLGSAAASPIAATEDGHLVFSWGSIDQGGETLRGVYVVDGPTTPRLLGYSYGAEYGVAVGDKVFFEAPGPVGGGHNNERCRRSRPLRTDGCV